MPHDFEQSRPDHQIHEKHIPEGHAHLDQKYDKGMRSPMIGQLPHMVNGLESPQEAPGVGRGEGGI